MKTEKTKAMEEADLAFSHYWTKRIGKCEVCGKKHDKLYIHHIIGRECKKLRYERDNTIVICWSCHQRCHQRGREVMATEIYKDLKGDAVYIYLRKARQITKPVGIKFYQEKIKKYDQ
jgi:hypothetical protein